MQPMIVGHEGCPPWYKQYFHVSTCLNLTNTAVKTQQLSAPENDANKLLAFSQVAAKQIIIWDPFADLRLSEPYWCTCCERPADQNLYGEISWTCAAPVWMDSSLIYVLTLPWLWPLCNCYGISSVNRFSFHAHPQVPPSALMATSVT